MLSRSTYIGGFLPVSVHPRLNETGSGGRSAGSGPPPPIISRHRNHRRRLRRDLRPLEPCGDASRGWSRDRQPRFGPHGQWGSAGRGAAPGEPSLAALSAAARTPRTRAGELPGWVGRERACLVAATSPGRFCVRRLICIW